MRMHYKWQMQTLASVGTAAILYFDDIIFISHTIMAIELQDFLSPLFFVYFGVIFVYYIYFFTSDSAMS